MIQKAKKAFRTISEAAEDLDVPQHVLRFWESKFSQVKPLKRGGNRRYYRPSDLKLLHAIKYQLYDQGHAIKEVQAMIREQGVKKFVDDWVGKQPAEAREEAAEKPPAPTKEAEEKAETPAPEKEEAPKIPLREDRETIQVSKDLVKALVKDLRALRQLIERLPD